MWYALALDLTMNPQSLGCKTMARKKSGQKSNDPKNDPLHEKLKRLLEEKRAGRTDTEIAEAAGMSRQALSQFMTGRNTNPKLQTLLRILKALDASLSDYDRA